MTPDLAAFSDWTLALLPRLFIYPGGLFLVAALALLRLTSGGAGALTPRAALRDLAGANTLSLAVTWAAIALLPVPSWPLPFAPGPSVLALLLALSLLLDITDERGRVQALAGGAITLALIVPPVGGVPGVIVWAIVGLAVVSGGLALQTVRDGGLPGRLRGVAWVWAWLAGGLALLPGEQLWLVPVVLLVAALALGLVLRAGRAGGGERAASPAIAWSLVLPALLAALLLGP